MEPITTLATLVSAFFGYYVGSDFCNYVRYRREFLQINSKLEEINFKLSKLNKNN